MSHKCTYYDKGYCLNVYGETCPYDGADEQCKCLEYEPKENYIAAFTNEIIESYKEQIKNLQDKLAKVLSQVNVSREMTLQEAKRQGVKEFAKKLMTKTHNYYPSIDSYYCSRHVVLVKDIDELLKEYEE